MLGLLAAVAATGSAAAEDKISFNAEIRPLLSDRCFRCHGPSEEDRQSELRLDVGDGPAGPFAEREGGRVIVPGDPAASLLWQRLVTEDLDLRMPPADSKKPPLTADEQQLIRRWIAEGASYEGFWAFQTPASPTPPAAHQVDGRPWGAERIDPFVLARLERHQMTPQSPADKRTLIRRVTFDLTGLPPTREQIAEFLADDSPAAYRRLVDRLIASPAYGEQMAKYWLDLVRFADTNGIHHDHYREMTPYRDWVIRAFNQNLPYDDFISYQLAGDLYAEPSREQLIASGFNRLHLVIDRGTALPQESYTRNVVDRVNAFGTTFMGLTLGCAVCHDHKYDPVTQRDFYQLFAFFNNFDTEPETPGRNVHPPLLRLPSAEQERLLRQADSRVADARQEVERLEAAQAEAAKTDDAPEGGGQPQQELKAAREHLKATEQMRDVLEKQIPLTLISRERSEMRPAHILIRGAYDRPGEQVSRGTPAFLPPLEPAGAEKTRMDLARWLTDPRHPLTSRVAVNRFWQQFFGRGLVKTSEDFGAQGEYPSHPALLDALSRSFADTGWDVKRLVRWIVLSETYRQSSKATPRAYRADPDNRLLGRGSRFRLDSEMIRDQILAASGLMNRRMYGKSVKPPQPPNLWKSVSMVSSSTYAFSADSGGKIHRRSVYSFWKRAMPPPQMTIFDAPTRESCIARRERTNTPVQALVLMNESQYFLAARHFAGRLLSEHPDDESQRLRAAYETVTSQMPDDGELAVMAAGLEDFRSLYRDDPEAALAMTSDLPSLDQPRRIELAAHTMLVNSLLNLDVAKTRQ